MEQLPDARPLVENLLDRALVGRASDVHIEPVAEGYELKFRIDGLLQRDETLSRQVGEALVNCLMVMGRLLTYRRDIPQEGRMPVGTAHHGTVELRLSVIPTLHGLRAVVRMPAELLGPHSLADLSLPEHALNFLYSFASAEQGLLAITGPAGSGKTTTVYALLQYIQTHAPGTSIISLEDPIERGLAGVTQIEITPFGEFGYARALKSILRQDPQVLALGEIRDAQTASLAVEAALTGHRLICTMHAGSPAAAISRWMEMGIERYQITASVHGILNQRLLRRKTGEKYHGRVPVAQCAWMDSALRGAIAAEGDMDMINEVINGQSGFRSLADLGQELIANGSTDAAEVQRVLGPQGRG
jgi:type II secretory ATPase GspE/PulE/Tfp pilus assembly ATPase PilB-like protein